MVWNLNLGSVNWPKPFARKRRLSDDGESPAPERPPRKKRRSALRSLAKQTEMDRKLSERRPAEWRPDITPDDQDFLTKRTFFETLLQDHKETVQTILDTTFAPEERQLLIPVAADRNPQLARIQEHNSKLFRDMLKSSAAFKEWIKESKTKDDIPFKLTTAYFGIPTEPLGFIQARFERAFDDNWSDGEEDLPVLQPHVRNLRFANQYLHRMYAHDSMRKPDLLLETYHVFDNYIAPPWEAQVPRSSQVSNAFSTLGLRGGGDDDEEEDDIYIHGHYRTTLGGEPLGSRTDDWITLYGYQGQVAFRLNNLNTFVDAVDRLLCLDNRAGVYYTLLMHDRRIKPTQNSWQSRSITCRGVGNFNADKDLLEWVNGELKKYEDEKSRSGATNMSLFVMAHKDPIPLRWEPDPVQDGVLRFELEWRHVPYLRRGDLAYLRVPQNLSSIEYTNQYGPWMANVCRVLAPGRIPERPGRPAIPDAYIGVKGFPESHAHLGSYGGLAFLPQLWQIITRSWEKDPTEIITLEATTTTDGLNDRCFLFLPGDTRAYNWKKYIRHMDISDRKIVEEVILGLIKASMSDQSYSKLSGVWITVPGESALDPNIEDEDVFLPVPREGEEANKEGPGPVVARLQDFVTLLKKKKTVFPAKNGLQMYPFFITVRPAFTEYTIRNARAPKRTHSRNPSECTLSEFRRIINRELGITLEGTSYIEIRQKPKPAESEIAGRTSDKPSFIIEPKTSENDWKLIRKMIVEPDIYVSLKDSRGKPIFGSKSEQPFGFFDIYSLPKTSLYRGVQEQNYPPKQRYYDYQLRGEDASAHFPTREPAGEARKKVKDPTTEEQPETPTPRPEEGRAAARLGRQIRARRAGHSLGFLNDPEYSDLQKSLMMREYSYFHPLDVSIENKIPINAPPLEHIVKIGKSSTPNLALGVLTPSETRRMMRDYFTMRNVLLDRTQICPHARCDFTYAVTQEAEFQKHLNDAHAKKEQCPFCESTDFPFWSQVQRAWHISEAHSDFVRLSTKKVKDAATATSPVKPKTVKDAATATSSVKPKPILEDAGTTTSTTTTTAPEPKPMRGPDTRATPRTKGATSRTIVLRDDSSSLSELSEPEVPPTKSMTRAAPRATPKSRSKPAVNPSPLEGEEDWDFCARCGRNHRLLANPTDRQQHDNICYFGALEAYQESEFGGKWEVCTECGVHIPESAGGLHQPHKRGPHPNKGYCFRCGLGLGQFGKKYQGLHVARCKGYGMGQRDGEFGFCPFCGAEETFGEGGIEHAPEWWDHVVKCKGRVERELAGNTVTLGKAVRDAMGEEGVEEVEEEEEEEEEGEKEVRAEPDDEYVYVRAKEVDEEGDVVISPIRTRSGVTTRARAGARLMPTLKAQEAEAEAAASAKKPSSRKRKTTVEEVIDEEVAQSKLASRRNVTFNKVVDVREIEPRPTRAAAKRRRT